MITYRSNKTDTLKAAYLGQVRVGYVEERRVMGPSPGWRWQLIMLRPEGGAYWGFECDEQSAKSALFDAFQDWMTYAELQHKGDDRDSPPYPPAPQEKTRTRATARPIAAAKIDRGQGNKGRHQATKGHSR